MGDSEVTGCRPSAARFSRRVPMGDSELLTPLAYHGLMVLESPHGG